MKKIILSLIFIVLFFFAFTNSVSAQCFCQEDYSCSVGCGSPNAGASCTPGSTECTVNVLPTGLGTINYSGLGPIGSPFLGSRPFGFIVGKLIPYIFTAAGVLLLLYLLYGGISLMLAQGDPKKIEGAKGIITGALIGFTIVFTAYWLVQIIGYVLGLSDFQTIFS